MRSEITLKLIQINQGYSKQITTILKSAVLSSLILLSGCASKTVYQEQTGFLDGYNTLISSKPSNEKIVHLYTGQDLSSLHKVNVKAVAVISGIPEAELDARAKNIAYDDLCLYDGGSEKSD